MSEPVIIAVDAMGGEGSPNKVIDGIHYSIKKSKDNFFHLYGNKNILLELIDKKKIKKYCNIIDTTDFISDDESPLTAAKKGKNTSMGSAIHAVKDKKADIILSAGNTGALLILSRMILNMLSGVEKPALAGLWPNKKGINVVLDLGANIECKYNNLIDFSNMGSALFKSLFPDEKAFVALLNVASEEGKGNENLKKAYNLLKESFNNNYDFFGYIEGNHIMDGSANVIVTDGFTGNVALKTAEGTANFIIKSLKKSLTKTFINKLSMILSRNSLKEFQSKLDPRKYNGAILLGLQGPVVKSHGATDYYGFAHSIEMCNKIIRGKLIDKIKLNLLKK